MRKKNSKLEKNACSDSPHLFRFAPIDGTLTTNILNIFIHTYAFPEYQQSQIPNVTQIYSLALITHSYTHKCTSTST